MAFCFSLCLGCFCTVTIDVRELADLGKSRHDVVSAIINSFHPFKPIAAIQFLGYNAKVTFERETYKREVMDREYVHIDGIECTVGGGGGEGGPRPQNVLVYNTSLMKFPMRLFVSV